MNTNNNTKAVEEGGSLLSRRFVIGGVGTAALGTSLWASQALAHNEQAETKTRITLDDAVEILSQYAVESSLEVGRTIEESVETSVSHMARLLLNYELDDDRLKDTDFDKLLSSVIGSGSGGIKAAVELMQFLHKYGYYFNPFYEIFGGLLLQKGVAGNVRLADNSYFRRLFGDDISKIVFGIFYINDTESSFPHYINSDLNSIIINQAEINKGLEAGIRLVDGVIDLDKFEGAYKDFMQTSIAVDAAQTLRYNIRGRQDINWKESITGIPSQHLSGSEVSDYLSASIAFVSTDNKQDGFDVLFTTVLDNMLSGRIGLLEHILLSLIVTELLKLPSSIDIAGIISICHGILEGNPVGVEKRDFFLGVRDKLSEENIGSIRSTMVGNNDYILSVIQLQTSQKQ